MLEIACSNSSVTRSRAVGSIALLIVGMLICADACAEERPGQLGSPMFVGDHTVLADLERAYWECDYDATTSGVGLSEGALCGEIYEELKRRKFAGDFPTLLRWWKQNKIAEHEAIRRKRANRGSVTSGAEL